MNFQKILVPLGGIVLVGLAYAPEIFEDVLGRLSGHRVDAQGLLTRS